MRGKKSKNKRGTNRSDLSPGESNRSSLRIETPDLPPNSNVNKLPDEVYGDTSIPAHQRKRK